MQHSTRWLTAVTTAALAFSCAQSNGDINRVQPNVVRKADLVDGEWFFRNSVSYTPFNTQFTFPGQTGGMEKLVWEVQENNLVGYRSYPYMPGAEANVDPSSRVSGTTAKYCDVSGKCTGDKKYYGSPVVAFPVLAHFDIQRGYNPATGEQTNVISENMTDRPWNEREFIRVNWAANILNKGSGMNWGTVQNPLGGSVSANWIQPNEKGEDPYDWPTFEYDDSPEKKLKYFDVTGRYLAAPDTVYYEDYGNIPLCYFAPGIYECSSSEIKMRISVSKVDPIWARDYEPMVYGNELMSLFGFFRTERYNWDRRFGALDSAAIRLAQRHRIWKDYFKKDGKGEPDLSQPIAAADRVVKPIVYYFTRADRMGGTERYDEFMEPARKVLEPEYDQAFRRAIAAARGQTGADDWKNAPRGFVLCDNPVKSGNNSACGEIGFSPKFGDLRYSFINTIAEPVANGLLGYGPSSADPETGQLMSGNSNTYTWGVDTIGRDITDWVLILAGEKSVNEFISGEDMRAFLKNNPVYNIAGITKQNATAALESELQGIPNRPDLSLGAFDRPTDRMVQLKAQLAASGGLPRATRDESKTVADQLAKSPELEAVFLDNPEVQADLANLLPPYAQEEAKRNPAFMRQMARSVLVNTKASNEWNKRRVEWLSKNSITMAEFSDRTLVGVANEKLGYRQQRVPKIMAEGHASCANKTTCTEVEAKRVADDEIAKQLRQETWLATTLHEFGHTVNLRHNFQGSFDAINYFDTYWDLRKSTITVAQNGEQKLPRTPADLRLSMGGVTTAESETQQQSGMHDYEYSSIMDYSGKRNGDWKGIGKYDSAAILFAYSGVSEPGGVGIASPGYVEVFDTARKDTRPFNGTDGNQLRISGAGTDLPMANAIHTNPTVRYYTERFHYTTAPLHFGEGTSITAVINDGIAKMRNRKLMKYSEVKKDEDRVAELLKADPTLLDDPDRASGLIGSPALRVPYMFCSDESADGPVLSCNRFDRGPDYFEMTRTKLEDYWNYYIDTHFRRDSLSFSGNRAVYGALQTFYDVNNSYKHWVFELYKNSARNQEQIARFKLDPIMQDTWTMGVLDGINQHLNVMSVPPFGLFMYRNNLRSGARWDVVSEGDDFDQLNATGRQRLEALYRERLAAQDFVELPRGLGRRMYSRYDFKSGFGFWNRMTEAGHYNDQLGAMFATAYTDLYMQGVDYTADQNRYSIPYYVVFRDEMTKTFGALWSQDEEKVRPILYKTFNDAGQITSKPALFNRVYVNGADIVSGFEYPARMPQACTGGAKWPTCFEAQQNAAPANIQLTWTSRIYALLLGLAYFRVNYDLDYAKANQIYRLGGSETFTVASGYHTVEVQDVTVGSRYLAIERDGAAPNSTAAVRMVNIANDYLTMVRDPATDPLPYFLFIQGYNPMPAAQKNNPALVEDRRRYWTELFRDQIRDMDLQRGMYNALGKAF